MRYLFLAGEASGDLHAAALIRELRHLDTEAEIRGMGGDNMVSAGASIVVHISELGFMGFTQLGKKAAIIRKTFSRIREEILAFQPDLIVPVDFGGFNLRMIRWAHKKGFRSVYYIPPKVWAWMPGRSRKLARYCEKVICILPFEPDFLRNYGVNAEYAGNPVQNYTRHVGELTGQSDLMLGEQEMIALLPGSRDQEIRTILPVMTSVVPDFPEFRFVVAACDPFPDEYYQNLTGSAKIEIIRGKTPEVLKEARAALVTSGTATLEAALLGVPQVVCYKTSGLSYLIARILIRVKYISLVNLILGDEAVKELIQSRLTKADLSAELNKILRDGPSREHIMAGYHELHKKLGDWDASPRAARILRAAAM